MKKLPVYVALDLDQKESALSVARKCAPYVEGFKIGPRLYFKSGPSLITKLKSYGKVFLDFKFFDIPSTVEASVRAGFDLGADLLTVHAQVGEECLKKLSCLEARLNQKRSFRILSITVLTSFSQRTLPFLLRPYAVSSHVESLADMVFRSGLKSLVCSGEELSFLRKRRPSAYLLTPGIRLACKKDSKEDQKRIFTPASALKAGASALVMGRPIYESQNPAGVLKVLQKTLSKAII